MPSPIDSASPSPTIDAEPAPSDPPAVIDHRVEAPEAGSPDVGEDGAQPSAPADVDALEHDLALVDDVLAKLDAGDLDGAEDLMTRLDQPDLVIDLTDAAPEPPHPDATPAPVVEPAEGPAADLPTAADVVATVPPPLD